MYIASLYPQAHWGLQDIKCMNGICSPHEGGREKAKEEFLYSPLVCLLPAQRVLAILQFLDYGLPDKIYNTQLNLILDKQLCFYRMSNTTYETNWKNLQF